MGVSQYSGYQYVGPYNKDYSILGFTLGSPYFGKPPNLLQEDEDEDSESTMAFESDIEATLIRLQGS